MAAAVPGHALTATVTGTPQRLPARDGHAFDDWEIAPCPAPAAALLRLGPVGTEAHVDLEWYEQLGDGLHRRADQRFRGVAFLLWHFENQLVVHSQQHARLEAGVVDRAIDIDHRELEDV